MPSYDLWIWHLIGADFSGNRILFWVLSGGLLKGLLFTMKHARSLHRQVRSSEKQMS